MTDHADPTPDEGSPEPGRQTITDRTVSEVVERTRDVIRKTREMLESSRDLLERVRHRDGAPASEAGEGDADEASGNSEASDARPVDGRA